MKTLRSRQGFTLIEIVLVLAIAGLLLAVVFLAVSGAQKARRDTQRKQDAAIFAAGITTYAANHRLETPITQTELNTYVAGYFVGHKDPSTGSPYLADFYGGGAPHDLIAPVVGHIVFVREHVCGSDPGTDTLVMDPPNYRAGIKAFAVLVGLEQGRAYCISGDN